MEWKSRMEKRRDCSGFSRVSMMLMLPEEGVPGVASGITGPISRKRMP